MKSLDGVAMTTEKLTYPRGTTEIKAKWENSTARTLIFGDFFYLAKKVNDNWIRQSIPNNTAFRAIGHIVSPFSKIDHTYRLGIYENLETGEYRIATYFFDEADVPITSDEAHYWLYADFKLS